MARITSPEARFRFMRRSASLRRQRQVAAQPIPETDDQLWRYIRDTWGVEIPRLVHPDCAGRHDAPFSAFADAFFCRVPTSLWLGSRGLGGKTLMLALLAATEAAVLAAPVSLLAGSEEQAQNAYGYLTALWERPEAPRSLLVRPPTKTELRLRNRGGVFVHRGSSRSARGQHRPRLRIDEVDEFKRSRSERSQIDVLDDALGQPMTQNGVSPQTLLASTWHYHDGAMALLLRRLRGGELDGRLYEWCYKESLERVVDGQSVGWLPESDVEAMRARMTSQQFAVEVTLQEPRAEDLAIDRTAVDAMWDQRFTAAARLGSSSEPFRGAPGEYIELPCCDDYEPGQGAHLHHRYATGCDWGRKRDYTAIVTYRTDLEDGWWLVAWEIDQGGDWPHLVRRFNDRVRRFPGHAAYDGTGIGDGLGALVEVPATAVLLSGGATGRRAQLFNDYIVAIENRRLLAPRIDRAWEDHRAVSRADLFGGGHPPDSFVAGALAWSCHRELANLNLDFGVDRLAKPESTD